MSPRKVLSNFVWIPFASQSQSRWNHERDSPGTSRYKRIKKVRPPFAHSYRARTVVSPSRRAVSLSPFLPLPQQRPHTSLGCSIDLSIGWHRHRFFFETTTTHETERIEDTSRVRHTRVPMRHEVGCMYVIFSKCYFSNE